MKHLCKTPSCTIRVLLVFVSLLIGYPTSAQGPSTSTTQHAQSIAASRITVERSKAGESIASCPCDPMMTARREAELTRILCGKSPFDWRQPIRLAELASDLATLMPVVLDTRGLDELGLDRDLELDGTEIFQSPKPRESQKRSWWKTTGKRGESEGRPSLRVQLLERLDPVDLTVMLDRGHLRITTFERAEDSPIIRVYDVSPLIEESRAGRWEGSMLTSTIETHVHPDTWEALGGNSTMHVLPMRGRKLLIVSSTTVVHWKVQALLDRLNQ